MEIKFDYQSKAIEKVKTSCLVLFLPKEIEATEDLVQLPKALQRAIHQLYELKDFAGKKGKSYVLYSMVANISRVALIGLGEATKVDAEVLRRAAGKAGQTLSEVKANNAAVVLPAFLKKSLKTQVGSLIAEGMALGAYQFTQYKTDDESKSASKVIDVTVFDNKKTSNAKAVQAGHIRAQGANCARDLGNSPGNGMTPTVLAKEAEAIAKAHNLTFKVLEEKDMKALGMDMLLGVSQGSEEPAKMIFLEYHYKKSAETVALVGKGLTFDAGGISLKPANAMEEMKFDMCGGAAVIGAMKAIGELKPKVNVIGVVPSSENLPDGKAQRPGDIVKSYAGKTVEIINTDAEGRLILGDALTYTARTYKPNAIIDLATLTGACVIALGSYAIGAISNNDDLTDKVVAAGKNSGDRVWPMPNFPEYEESLKGKYSDLLNVGGRPAGTITAGLFLKNFVENVPWVHLDIAGTAWGVTGIDYHPNKGATGAGVRLLLDLLENW